MKYRRSDFLAAREGSIQIDENLGSLPAELFEGTIVEYVPECYVEGILSYDGKSKVVSRLQISGILEESDSITGEPVNVEFETESETLYAFDPVGDDEEEITVVLQDTIDLTPEIIQAIVYEAPMSITRLAREDFPSGQGWSLISDQDAAPAEPVEDPRWAKLKEFQIEDD